MTYTEERLVKVATRAAKTYCRKHNAWTSYDDAIGDASLYLLSMDQTRWRTKTNDQLVFRVVGELERGYQREHGTRRKAQQLRRVDYDLETVAVKDQIEEPPTKADNRLEIVERALRQPDVVGDSDVVRAILACESFAVVAKRFKISKARVSQIFLNFKTVCRRLDSGPGVSIVDSRREDPTPAERAANPLFYL